MTAHCTVVTADGPVSVPVRDGVSVLQLLMAAPTPTVAVGCRGGGCGVCRVRIVAGEFTCRRMSRRFVSEDDERDGVVLACRLYASGDLVVRPEPRQLA